MSPNGKSFLMKLSTEEIGEVICLLLEGRADAVTSEQLSAALLPLLEKNAKVLLDCSSLEYISSAGLRILLLAHKTGGKRLALCGLTSMVLDVLEVSGFDSLFQIAQDREQGLEMLAS